MIRPPRSTPLLPYTPLFRPLVCFEADAESAARLPRWGGDDRRPWFCFENQAQARRALGPPSDGVKATVVIDRFVIHRGLSDRKSTRLTSSHANISDAVFCL